MSADFISVSVVGDRNLLRNLDQMPDTVRAILAAKVGTLTEDLEDAMVESIEANLGSKTGRLAASVKSEVIIENGRIDGRVYIDNVPYAKIQDVGGVIPAHMIYPQASKVLAFIGATGDKVFATRVFHPGATIPPTYYSREARRSIAVRASRDIKNAVVQGIRARMRAGQ